MLSGANGTSIPVLRSGYMISNYRVVRLLGQGGMGTVYEVKPPVATDRQCALKMLHPRYKGGETAKRFHREIKLGIDKLKHPHIVEIFDYGTKHNVPYFVMEMLTGEDLAARLQRGGAMTFEEAYPILEQVIDALTFAHDENVVHRDLKPENIFLCSSGVVKLLDFGIAKITDEAAKVDTLVTQDLAVLGTPHYMSPEQALGHIDKIDHRTDIFALGAIIYQMLSGELAFAGTSANEVIVNIATGRKSESFSKIAPNLPTGMHDFIKKALEKDPNNRFQSMRELGNRLKSIHQRIHANDSNDVHLLPSRDDSNDVHLLPSRDANDDAHLLTSPDGVLRFKTPDIITTTPTPKRRGRAGLCLTLAFLAIASGVGAAYYLEEPHVRSVVDRVIRIVLEKKKELLRRMHE